MAKGKKYNAAEKHFMEIEARLQKSITFYRERLSEVSKENDQIRAENEELREDNRRLNAVTQQLKTLLGLSDSEIKEMVHRNETLSNLAQILKYTGFYAGEVRG